jgi:hypothetical protein
MPISDEARLQLCFLCYQSAAVLPTLSVCSCVMRCLEWQDGEVMLNT